MKSANVAVAIDPCSSLLALSPARLKNMQHIDGRKGEKNLNIMCKTCCENTVLHMDLNVNCMSKTK